jgi:arabinan endo-1,5-alpha-L-arabinosidase
MVIAMTNASTGRAYRNTKTPWLIFGMLVAIALLLITLYAIPGMSGRLGLPVLTTKTSYTNPIFDFDFPDPAILQAPDGWYYAYATQGITPEFKYENIQLARSRDLVHWQRLPDALPEKPLWAKYTWDFWAPQVVYHDGLYYMYYSAEPDKGSGLCLAVATAKQPAGPFTDKGEPLKCGPGFSNIDPFAFDDPQSGRRYLYWGSNSTPIRVQELAEDRLNFQPDTVPLSVLIPERGRPYEDLLEGAWVTYREGFYYLFTSGDACCGEGAHYAVMVARSTSPTGTFAKLGDTKGSKSSVILEANAAWTAPGHNAIFTDAGGQDWIFYHAINAKEPGHNDVVPDDDYYPRVLLMDRIMYVNGWPEIAGGSPSYKEEAGPSVAIDLFTWIAERSSKP